MQHPDEKLTATSRYSHAEICATLDRWCEVEKQYDAVLASLPEGTVVDWLEPVVCPVDGAWHRAGNAEMFPVQKWRKLIKQHECAIARLRS